MQFCSTHAQTFSNTFKRSSLLAVLLSQAWLAQAADFNIPAQALDKALNTLAKQSGERILFSTDLTENISAPAVKGNLSTREALNHLLKNSGLVLQGNATQGYTVVKRPPAQSQEYEETLPEVVVAADAEKETASSHIHGYVAKRSTTATKTDTPIIETPQSISVVTADQIVAQKSQSIVDALAYTAGVAVRESGRVTESFVLRGFQADGQRGSLYRDGTKYTSNIYRGQQEPYGLERIELLRGAASVLYGNTAPGGIINSVSKRPSIDPLHELNVEFGSFDRKQVSGDFSDRLTEDGEWSYRLTGLFRDSDTFVDHVPDNRTFIAPAIKWQPSDATSVTLLSQYKKTESKYMYGLSAYGTVKPSVNGKN